MKSSDARDRLISGEVVIDRPSSLDDLNDHSGASSSTAVSTQPRIYRHLGICIICLFFCAAGGFWQVDAASPCSGMFDFLLHCAP